MGRVFSYGILSSIYGAAIIGGANTVVILMGDDTKSHFYRVKYGFAIGTILGLVYGTIMGIKGLPLIPTFESDAAPSSAPKSHFVNRNIFYALSSLRLDRKKKDFAISTKILHITF